MLYYNAKCWGLIPLVLLLILLPLSLAKKCEERIKRECKETEDYQCYFNPERTCFKHYDTNCEMELDACKDKTKYEPWPEHYCESVQFMCSEELNTYPWPPEDFLERIAHIRDNHTNPYEGMF